MSVGIDRISFYTSRYCLPLEALAEARGVEPEKYRTGLGQDKMSVPPPDEDIVTMAASAAASIVSEADRESIDLLLFATESGIDQSKSAGLFVHSLLGLSPHCRVVELKQACYGATVGLRMATAMVQSRPGSRALVLASDAARYDLGSPGEPTQGCGAVAMMISSEPGILVLDAEAGLHASDVMDFWRPNYRDEALVDGKFSTRVYLQSAQEAWRHYARLSGRRVDDFARFCYHLPFTKMARKAHERVLLAGEAEKPDEARLTADLGEGLLYSRLTGNTYTASLYESLTCLLDQAEEDLGGKRIGLFSYGSGAVGEFFSGVVQRGYREHLLSEEHGSMLEDRTSLSCQEYEDIFNLKVPQDGWKYVFAQYRTGPFRFGGIDGHKRSYERVA